MTDYELGDRATARKSETIVMIENRPVPVRSIPQCIVCQSRDREIVERGHMMGRSLRRIVLDLPDDSEVWLDRDTGETVTLERARSRVDRHFQRGHGNQDQTVRYAIMEAIARKQGVDIEGTVDTIVTEVGVLSEVMRRGYEQLASSDRAITTNQMLRAAETLMALKDVDDGVGSASQFEEAIRSFIAIIQNRFGDEAVQLIISDMQASPEIDTAVRSLQAEN